MSGVNDALKAITQAAHMGQSGMGLLKNLQQNQGQTTPTTPPPQSNYNPANVSPNPAYGGLSGAGATAVDAGTPTTAAADIAAPATADAGLAAGAADIGSAVSDAGAGLGDIGALADIFAANGGRIARGLGGATDTNIPYDTGTGESGINIPDQAPDQKLDEQIGGIPGVQGKQGSDGGGFNPLSAIGPLLSLFALKDGGAVEARKGLASGGWSPSGILDDISGDPTNIPDPAPQNSDATQDPPSGLAGSKQNEKPWATPFLEHLWDKPPQGQEPDESPTMPPMKGGDVNQGVRPSQPAAGKGLAPIDPFDNNSIVPGSPAIAPEPKSGGVVPAAKADEADVPETHVPLPGMPDTAPTPPTRGLAAGADKPEPNATEANGDGDPTLNVPETKPRGGLQPEAKPAAGQPGKQKEPSAYEAEPDPRVREGSGGGGAGDWLRENQHLWGPLLTGLGAMASSNSRYLGSAILQGLGAGASSYQNILNNEAEREAINSGAQHTRAATNNLQAENWNFTHNKEVGPNSMGVVNGRLMPATPGMPYNPPQNPNNTPNGQQGGQPAQGGAPAGVDASLAKSVLPGGVEFTQKDAAAAAAEKTAGYGNPAAGQPGLWQTKKPISDAYVADIGGQAIHAGQNMKNNTDLAANTSDLISKGSPEGAQGYSRAAIMKTIATYAADLGIDVSGLQSATTATDVQNKLNAFASQIGANGAHSRAFAEVEHFAQMLPNINNTPEANADVMAKLLVDNRRVMDENEYAQEYQKRAGTLASGASNAFNNDENRQQMYQNEQKVIATLMADKKHNYSARAADMFRGKYSAEENKAFLKHILRNQPGMYSDRLASYFPSRPQ
jgi:hypothetical protein